MYEKRNDTKKMVMTAILIALVVILQYMGSFVRLGPFSVSLVLIPIVIGAAIGGVSVGAILGLAFGAVVLISGDAALFMAISIPGTIITVLLKGILCGFCAALSYKAVEGRSKALAVVLAAIVCPIVNTGVFLLGCFVFFIDAIKEMAAGEGMALWGYIMFILVGGNFVFEMLTNIILSPAAVRLINLKK